LAGRDAKRVAGIVGESAPGWWVQQCHGLHGPDNDGPVWRRAIDDTGALVGCAFVIANPLSGALTGLRAKAV
jgi:hypothetical protein